MAPPPETVEPETTGRVPTEHAPHGGRPPQRASGTARPQRDAAKQELNYGADAREPAQHAIEDNFDKGSMKFRVPVRGAHASSEFGHRERPLVGWKDGRPVYGSEQHKGLDLGAPTGTEIDAAASGRVVSVGDEGDGYGNKVIIDHGNGYTTTYGHMKGFQKGLRVGMHVEEGQPIGQVGSTGHANGPHCHYEIRHNGEAINPRIVTAGLPPRRDEPVQVADARRPAHHAPKPPKKKPQASHGGAPRRKWGRNGTKIADRGLHLGG